MAIAGCLVLVAGSMVRAGDNAEQERAVAEIMRLGGNVEIDANRPGKPVVLVNLNRTKVTDAALKSLQSFPQLEALAVVDTNVTDTGLMHLKGLSQLKTLGLGGTKVTDAGLKHLKESTRLEVLNLGGTKVTDAGLAHLKGFPELKRLYLFDTKVTDTGLKHLGKLTQLQLLIVTDTAVTEAGVKELQKSLPKVIIIHESKPGGRQTDPRLQDLDTRWTHQSGPSESPPFRLMAARRVASLVPFRMKWREPSAMQARKPSLKMQRRSGKG
jgi:hypothetical protein